MMMNMEQIRKYGKTPYTCILLHGGPGARGEMETVAEELSKNFGVIEHLQSGLSISEEIKALEKIIDVNFKNRPVVIGFSWGAWLSLLFAARYPDAVKKTIIIGCGPLEEKYAKKIEYARLKKLGEREKKEFSRLLNSLKLNNDNAKILELERLLSKTDCFSPAQDDAKIEFDAKLYEKIWEEAQDLRRSGKLLEEMKKIRCPVFAIHGDYDPHPAEGVMIPLSSELEEFRFILLDKCGHKPWIEKYAKEKFFNILKQEIRNNS